MSALVVSVYYRKTETFHLTLALNERQQETLRSMGADLKDPRSIFEHLMADNEHGGDRLVAANSRVQTTYTFHEYDSGSQYRKY